MKPDWRDSQIRYLVHFDDQGSQGWSPALWGPFDPALVFAEIVALFMHVEWHSVAAVGALFALCFKTAYGSVWFRR